LPARDEATRGTSTRRARLFVPAVALLAASALAQDQPEVQARRLLEDGRAYWSQGKMKQALDNFNIIVTSFSNTESVGQALLEIGRYRMEVEGDAEKARAAFDEVAKKYPQSDGAPGAYYYLGYLTLSRGTSPAELDDALAQFTRVQNLYPRSSWVPRAIYASGLAHRKAGRLPEAIEAERRVSLEYPSSEAAPAAQFEIGQCFALTGEPLRGMEEFQQVRNRFPGSPWAAQSLDRITALYRLHGSGKPTFALDATFSAGAGDLLKDVRAIQLVPGGGLWIASDKTRSAVLLEPGGKTATSLTGEDLRTLSLSPRGDLVLASKLAVRIGPRDIKTFSIPSDKPGVPEPLERVLAATVTAGGSILVSDEKRKKVYRFDSRGQHVGTFPDGKEREVTRLYVDPEGGIVMLDRAERTVRVFDETGRLLRTAGPGGLRKPADVAVDAFRNAYVADEEAGILVFTPQGQLLATIAGPELRRPKALTLDPTGAVLVYDDRAERVLRFR
jgi:TolA-binding protein